MDRKSEDKNRSGSVETNTKLPTLGAAMTALHQIVVGSANQVSKSENRSSKRLTMTILRKASEGGGSPET